MVKSTHKEFWLELQEYPGYAISELGNIMNTNTDIMKQPSKNQQGILMVNFSRHGRQTVRSVALLVADRFVDRRDWPDYFDTPIHLNGDREDCAASNLSWRPRWFAVMYHKQFSNKNFGVSGFSQPIKNTETGEVFVNTWDAALQYGMLENQLVLNTLNHEPVPFQGYVFDFV